MKKKRGLLIILLAVAFAKSKAQLISGTNTGFDLTKASIIVDSNDCTLVQKAAQFLQQDIEAASGKKIPILNTLPPNTAHNIIIGTISQSSFIRANAVINKTVSSRIQNLWEGYTIQTIHNNLVIAGSDRRGTAFGVFELSKQIGISPWYWWADVPVKKTAAIFVNPKITITDAPKVKYRGIFINDEAPALSNWSKEKFGGFNHVFYEKVFELMLRLRANYIWPAMWGNAFYDDDSLNIKAADDYGIVIGTSHHEPLMRAHVEWRRYGKGQKWNYDSTEAGLKEFWKTGMQRATNEKIVTLGMRGDGDEPMSRETATTLLERIVKDQRKIIAGVTGKPAEQTPQLWALYKEVQEYYDKGMRVPDDVTLLLCDDNWGNIRRLPEPTAPKRKGGYGIYYHFDYVGGPRNYKWVNTNPLPRIWEQMHLAYQHHVKDIWIVNVGDIKPMEFPISFFLDYAWNPEKIGPADLQQYTTQWCAAQFGNTYAAAIAEIISRYSKYNGRRKPELLDENTYSFNYNEWPTVVNSYKEIVKKAEQINTALPASYQDAFYQLVLHPVKACANLYDMYYHVALNKQAYRNKQAEANTYADKVKQLYEKDSLITLEYHNLNNGKWNHMMSQTHIGYTYWQQPQVQKMPEVKYLPADEAIPKAAMPLADIQTAKIPAGITGHVFYEDEEKGVSIEASHFTKANNTNRIQWTILPDHGRTGAAITAFPVTAPVQHPGNTSPHLAYEFYTFSQGAFTLQAYFSPTLNIHNTDEGLQYAVSIDDETPQIISINKEDKNSISGVWNKWVAEHIIIKTSRHSILYPGKHTLKYWMVNPCVVLQKIVLDFGNLQPSYLGPPETRHQ
ncbi:MAG TPA: glycosyl hydrolase 115 family protein [Ferruginibacter sp.]|nr:glycosyl hydrolase 115 family protein [Ferruginibacter sp.]HMP21111.1 glycosyl hydrolase 115 family protein [Ferruginibacter sp.]